MQEQVEHAEPCDVVVGDRWCEHEAPPLGSTTWGWIDNQYAVSWSDDLWDHAIEGPA